MTFEQQRSAHLIQNEKRAKKIKNLRQKKKSIGLNLLFLVFQIIIISPFILIWLYTILTAAAPFLTHEYWYEFSKFPSIILALLLGYTIVRLAIPDFSEFLSEYTLGVLLVQVILFFAIGCLLSMMIMLTVPKSITQIFGKPAQLTAHAKKFFDQQPGRDSTCYYKILIDGQQLSGAMCISEGLYKQLPESSFDLKITGKQSQFGMLITSTQRVNAE